MNKKIWFLISALLVASMLLVACGGAATTVAPTEVPVVEQPTEVPAAEEPSPVAPAEAQPTAPAEPAAEGVHIVFWTNEGEADNAFQYVQSLADAYTALHPEVTFEVVNKQTETLREDFQTSSLAGAPPDLLWTVNDHAGPFTAAQLIMPVDDMFDLTGFVDSALAAVKLDGQTWGVPITNGNHLMLYFNKDLVPTAPANTDEMVAAAKPVTDAAAGTYGLIFNQTEPFWLVPWLGGFGGKVFAEDGLTPTLNTPEMVSTLQLLHDFKFTDGILPAESDYDVSDGLFKEGKVGMIVNGDWALGAYKELFGDKLGVTPIPQIVASGGWPAPYTSGKFFMLPEGLEGAKLDAIKDFILFATDTENQLDMVAKLSRLPATKEALSNEIITADPYLAGSALAMSYGTPMPTVLEMRCNWDAMKPEMQAVLADQKSAEDAAAAMQAAAESCVATLE